MSVKGSVKGAMIGLNVESLMDSPFDSSVILSGCCTSTPLDTPNNSIVPRLSFIEEDEVENKIMSPLHPDINFASKPIFGRLNLQSLNDCLKKDEKVTRQDLIKLLRNEDSTDEHIASSARGSTVYTSIKNQQNYGEDSASAIDNFKREFKTNIKKQTNQLATGLTKVREVPHTFQRTVNYTVKRQRSNNIESNRPILKINGKIPKSPKLLTALRAKQREKRKESIIKKSPNNKIHLSQSRATTLNKKSNPILKLAPTPSSTETSSNRTSNSRACVSKKKENELDKKTNAFLSVHFQSVREGTANNYEQLRSKKIYPLENERMTSYTDQKKIDAQKMTAFKAPFFYKIPGLPIVNKRKITIPTSPKLGQRRNLSSK